MRCVAQFSISNVHKRGLKHHHFISFQMRCTCLSYKTFCEMCRHALFSALFKTTHTCNSASTSSDPVYIPNQSIVIVRGIFFEEVSPIIVVFFNFQSQTIEKLTSVDPEQRPSAHCLLNGTLFNTETKVC